MTIAILSILFFLLLLTLTGKFAPVLAACFSLLLSSFFLLVNWYWKSETSFPAPQHFVPQNYDVERSISYRFEGSTKWDNGFKQVLKRKLNWQEATNAANKICINCKPTFRQDTKGDAQRYVVSDEVLKISLNGELCCCKEIPLPDGLAGKNPAEAAKVLQEKLPALFKQHETVILDELYACRKWLK